MAKTKKRKKNTYSRLAPVLYSPQYQRWNVAAKKGDSEETEAVDLVHRRYLATRPSAQRATIDASRMELAA